MKTLLVVTKETLVLPHVGVRVEIAPITIPPSSILKPNIEGLHLSQISFSGDISEIIVYNSTTETIKLLPGTVIGTYETYDVATVVTEAIAEVAFLEPTDPNAKLVCPLCNKEYSNCHRGETAFKKHMEKVHNVII